MITVKRTSAEGKILEILAGTHPVDFESLAKKTGFRRDRLELALKRLRERGIVSLDCYPERYITLLRTDIEFTGTRRQHKTIKTDRNAQKARCFEGRGYG